MLEEKFVSTHQVVGDLQRAQAHRDAVLTVADHRVDLVLAQVCEPVPWRRSKFLKLIFNLISQLYKFIDTEKFVQQKFGNIYQQIIKFLKFISQFSKCIVIEKFVQQKFINMYQQIKFLKFVFKLILQFSKFIAVEKFVQYKFRNTHQQVEVRIQGYLSI